MTHKERIFNGRGAFILSYLKASNIVSLHPGFDSNFTNVQNKIVGFGWNHAESHTSLKQSLP